MTKTYDLCGNVVSAEGLMSGTVTGKRVLGMLTITGDEASFHKVIGCTFELGGQITEAPGMDSSKTLKAYQFTVESLDIKQVLELPGLEAEFSCTLVPWDRIMHVRITLCPTSWFKRRALDNIKIEGMATLV